MKILHKAERGVLKGTKNRILQLVARFGPGEKSLRIALHRLRGVKIGRNVAIGYDVVVETACPEAITIGDNVSIALRSTIVAHFKEATPVKIEDEVHIGPGAIILGNVVIGRGSVVTAGSVVTRSVPPMTLVQGNPAAPVAICGVSLSQEIGLKEFYQKLKPLAKRERSGS